MTTDKPFISRILALEDNLNEGYGLEVVFDNPMPELIWIDQIELAGKADQFINFRIVHPFFHSLTYGIYLDCELTEASERNVEYKLKGQVYENEQSNWAYMAKGEFNYSFPSHTGKSWDYRISFPVILEIASKGRAAIRLLFSLPSKAVIKEEHKGSGPAGMYISHTDVRCWVSAVTNIGLVIEKEMDDSFLNFVANKGNMVKQSKPDANKYNLVELRRSLEETFDLEEFRTLCFDLGVDYDALRGEGKSAKIRELWLI